MTATEPKEGDLWLGVDIGTQSVKATLVSATGSITATGKYPLASTRDPERGRHEQDPRSWIDATANAIGEALAQLPKPELRNIRGLSYCSTSGTIVVVGGRGEPKSSGLMYDDSRGADFAGVLVAAGHHRFEPLGIVIQPSWAACRIAWLASEEQLPAGTFIAHQGDVVASAITGSRVATDWTSALKSGYDPLALEWPQELLDAARVSRECMPEVVAPGTLIGVSTHSWQDRCGLPSGTPVFAGMTDGCAAQLGAGALSPGDWHSVIGTTLVIKGVCPHPISGGNGAVYSHRAPYGNYWLPGGASNVGAGALTALAASADLAQADAAIATRTEPIAVSYPLTRRGERFPFLSRDATGFALLPMDGRGGAEALAAAPLSQLATLSQTELVESIWAGVACTERLCFETLAAQGAPITGRLSSSGGGTQSVTWTRMRATLLDRPIALPVSAEGSLGAAILACWGRHRLSDDGAHSPSLPQVAGSMSRIRTVIDPEPSYSARLSDAYGTFRQALTKRGWI